MRAKKSVKITVMLLAVVLLFSLVMSQVIAQGNQNGSQQGKKSVKGLGCSQRYLIQQQNQQKDALVGCVGCATDSFLLSGKGLQQGKNENGAGKNNQNQPGCTGECDACTEGNVAEESVKNQSQKQNQWNQQTQQMKAEIVEANNQETSSCTFAVEITGQELKTLTISEIAQKWSIDPVMFLASVKDEFSLQGSYYINSALDDLRQEYKFSPAQIKTIAQNIKNSL